MEHVNATHNQPASNWRRSRLDRAAIITAWLALATFVAVALGAFLVGQRTLLAADLLNVDAPWSLNEPGVDRASNPWVGDTIDSVAPVSTYMSDEIRQGDMPLWNPYSAGGVTLGALPDYAMFSPLSLPWYITPPWYAPAAVKLLEIAAVTLGMVLLARRLRLHPAAGPLMALAFASSGFMLALTTWPQTRVAALLPLLLWATERLLQEKTWRSAIPLPIVLCSMLLGGFPALVGYAGYLLAAYVVVRLIAARATRKQWLRLAVIGVASAIAGVGLAAWQIVPFAQNAALVVDFESREQTPLQHIETLALSTLVAPAALGEPSDQHWGTMNPVERFSFAGASILALAAVAVLARQRRGLSSIAAFAAVGGALAVALIYLGGPLLGAFQELPIFSNNFIGRLRSVLGLFIALLAGIGLTWLLRRGEGPTERRRPGAATLLAWGGTLAFAATIAYFVNVGVLTAPASERRAVLVSTAIALGFSLVAFAAAVVAVRRRGRVAALAIVALMATASLQAISAAQPWWPGAEPREYYPDTPTTEFLEANIGSDRSVGIDDAMLSGTGTAYRIRQATGHSFHSPAWRELLQAADPFAMQSATLSKLKPAALVSPVLDRMSVRYASERPNAALQGALEATETPDATSVVTADTPLQRSFTGPLRGVQFSASGVSGPSEIVNARVEVVDAAGQVITSTDIEVLRADNARPVAVALVGLEDRSPDDAASVRIVVPDDASSLAVETAGGEWAPALVRPIDDGLRVVHAGDSTVYERERALPRFRWSSEAVVEREPTARIAAMSDPALRNAVVLDTENAPLADAGSEATIDVVQDDGDTVILDVSASGAGFVTIADALQVPGWSATIGGAPAELLDADHAMGAVAVPAGQHRIELRYDPPGLALGTTSSLTVLGLLLIASAAVAFRRRAPRGRREKRWLPLTAAKGAA